MVRSAAIACVVLVASCSYRASFEDCVVACGPDESCPEGLQCDSASGLCRDPSGPMVCPPPPDPDAPSSDVPVSADLIDFVMYDMTVCGDIATPGTITLLGDPHRTVTVTMTTEPLDVVTVFPEVHTFDSSNWQSASALSVQRAAFATGLVTISAASPGLISKMVAVQALVQCP